MKLTQEKAREMEHKGYVLTHISMNTDGTDTYNVYLKEAK